jgi:hypothetical protein
VRTRGTLRSLVATPSLLLLSTAHAWAQVSQTPSSGGAPGSSGGGSAVAIVVVIVAALVIVGIGVKLYDLRRSRESEAVQLQAQISDALMREQSLFSVPIIATARASLWRRSTATIEVAGQVPSQQAHETALRIVRAEAARIRSDFQIEDRISVVPPHAA